MLFFNKRLITGELLLHKRNKTLQVMLLREKKKKNLQVITAAVDHFPKTASLLRSFAWITCGLSFTLGPRSKISYKDCRLNQYSKIQIMT